MRTFLSHDATAKCSDCGENERSEMPSSGGLLSATSFDMSPVVLLVEEALVVAALPKRPDILGVLRLSSPRRFKAESRRITAQM